MNSETARNFPLLLPLTLIAVLAGSPAFGQTTTWTGSTGDWFVPGNWSAGVPDTLLAAEIQNGGKIASGQAIARVANVGTAPASSGTLSLSGNSRLSLMENLGAPGGAGRLQIGTSGTGLVALSDSARLVFLEARIGNDSGGDGSLNVSGGTLEGADLGIGLASPGNVNLSGTGVWQGWNGQLSLGATVTVHNNGVLNLSDNF